MTRFPGAFVRIAVSAAAALALSNTPVPAQQPPSQTRVDLELLLAVDISQSMDYDEHELQRNGYVEAFRHQDVVNAITSGPRGKIAVAYMEWAGDFQPIEVIPWMIIDSQETAKSFSNRLAAEPIYSEQRTSISRALIHATELIENNDISGARRVIDVSGDGANNAGPPVAEVRDAVVKRGIIVNGLPIMLNKPREFYDIANLDRYYRHCVIGGQGAFIAPVFDLQQVSATIRKKLVMEIANLDIDTGAAAIRYAEAPSEKTAGSPPLRRAQLKIPEEAPDCLAGEKVWGGSRFGRYRGFENFGDSPR